MYFRQKLLFFFNLIYQQNGSVRPNISFWTSKKDFSKLVFIRPWDAFYIDGFQRYKCQIPQKIMNFYLFKYVTYKAIARVSSDINVFQRYIRQISQQNTNF